MRRLAIISIICFLVVAFLFVSARSLLFYEGRYQSPATALPGIDGVSLALPATGLFTKVPEQQAGTVLVDFSHDNNFSPWEMNALLSRLVSGGFAAEFLKPVKSEEKDRQPKQVQELREKLRFVDAFVIISPQTPITGPEVSLIKQFVKKGGKLLLVEDPARRPRGYAYTRTGAIPINDVSAEFGVIFENDYLYNLTENDGNYRYVSFRDFSQGDLTRGLRRITLYSAGSLNGGTGVVFADGNTLSSNTEARGRLSPITLAADSKVLAIHNLAFMVEPFNASFDNDRLVSNLSDWLTNSERVFSLSDFPHFLKETMLVAFADVSQLRTGMELNNLLADLGRVPRLMRYEETAGLSQDTVFVGLFKDAAKVRGFLERGNIAVTGAGIEVRGIGTVLQAGTGVIYLYKEGDRQLLVILGDTQKRLQEIQELLKSGEFRRWLVSDTLAIYQPADFSIGATPGMVSLTSGGSATFDVSIVSSGGFADMVRLTSASAPPGLTVTPASASVASPYPVTTFTVTSTAPGTYAVTITGAAGNLIHTVTVAVTVNARPER